MKKFLALFLGTSLLLSASPAFAFFGKGLALKLNFNSAIERWKEIFEHWSKILGIPIEKNKRLLGSRHGTTRDNGKRRNYKEKVKENIKNLKLEQRREFLQNLVDKGIISKEETEKMLEVEKQ